MIPIPVINVTEDDLILTNIFNFYFQEMNVQLIGLCCVNVPAYIRTVAETLGRSPPASVYSPDMSQHRSELHKYQFNKYTEAWTLNNRTYKECDAFTLN